MTNDEDWTAAVADKIIDQTRRAADRLRNCSVQQLGLAPRSPVPGPAHIASDSSRPAADNPAPQQLRTFGFGIATRPIGRPQ
jgi:hypothetical protein